MERSKASMKKISTDGLSHPNQNTIIKKHNMVIFLKKLESIIKFNKQKNKMDFSNQE